MDSASLPKQSGQKSKKVSSGRQDSFEAGSGCHTHADERIVQPPHSDVAKPWLLLRSQTRPLGMATSAHLPDSGRFIHAKLCASLSGAARSEEHTSELQSR